MTNLGWMAAAVVTLSSAGALAETKAKAKASARAPADVYARLFRPETAWLFQAKRTFAHDSQINTWKTKVTCTVAASTTIGAARRSTIECAERNPGRKESDVLRSWTFVATDTGIWTVAADQATTEAQIASLDPATRWITTPPAERTWTEQVPTSGSPGKTHTKTSRVVPWRRAWCLLVRDPMGTELVACIAPGKGLVGIRDDEGPDGYSFGTVPSPRDAERWK